MIIKSMSRKQQTFGQLVDYFEDGRQDAKYNLYHNIYSTNAEQITREFQDNARFLGKRKNGVYLYHEILSIKKTDNLSLNQQKDILRDIGNDYILSRANGNLVYGVMHDDKDGNLHYHFMISSNEVMSDKKYRLSKEQFSQIKKQLELKVLNKYPELEQTKLINKEPGKSLNEKLSNKGVELKRRTGKTPQRESVKERLEAIFNQAKTKDDFFKTLEKEQLSLYVRGNTIGVLDQSTNRKHRLKTLGMQSQFDEMSKRIAEAELRKEEVKSTRNEFNASKTENKDYSRSEQPSIDKNKERLKRFEQKIDKVAHQSYSSQAIKAEKSVAGGKEDQRWENTAKRQEDISRVYKDNKDRQNKAYTPRPTAPKSEQKQPVENRKKPKPEKSFFEKLGEKVSQVYHDVFEKDDEQQNRNTQQTEYKKPRADDKKREAKHENREQRQSRSSSQHRSVKQERRPSDNQEKSREQRQYRQDPKDRYQGKTDEKRQSRNTEDRPSYQSTGNGGQSSENKNRHQEKRHQDSRRKTDEKTYQNRQTETAMEREIRKRKEEMQKQRRDEVDYSKDYSRDR